MPKSMTDQNHTACPNWCTDHTVDVHRSSIVRVAHMPSALSDTSSVHAFLAGSKPRIVINGKVFTRKTATRLALEILRAVAKVDQ